MEWRREINVQVAPDLAVLNKFSIICKPFFYVTADNSTLPDDKWEVENPT